MRTLFVLFAFISIAFGQQSRSGELVLMLNEDTYNSAAMKNGRRLETAPAIAGASNTHWLIANEDLGPNARDAGFGRVVVADFDTFMLPGLRGDKVERRKAMALVRHVFRASVEVVEENSSLFKLAQATTQAVSSDFPNDPRVSDQWHLQDIGVKKTWTPSTGSLASVPHSAIKTVMVDSGVAPSADIARNIDTVNSRIFFGKTSPLEDPSTTGIFTPYPYGHGTLGASIIGAVGNNGLDGAGIDWQAQIVSYRVFAPVATTNGTTLTTSYEAVLKAFVALLDLGDHLIVNASFTMGPDASDLTGSLWKKAIEALGDKGLIIAAAGNEGSNALAFPCTFGSSNVLCVAATNERRQLSSFSNWGEMVKMAAPGENILSTGNDGTPQWSSGTSVAAPMVDGVAELVWKRQFSLTSRQLLQVLLDGAEFNPSLVGKIDGARQLSYPGSLSALDRLADNNPRVRVTPVTISAILPMWSDEPGLPYGGIATIYGSGFTGDMAVLVNQYPVPLLYVSPWQINAYFPMDAFQFLGGNAGNTVSVRRLDVRGSLAWAAVTDVRAVSQNPGFLREGGALVTETRGSETVVYCVGLGFTNPWIRAGTVAKGTEQVVAPVQVLLDGKVLPSSVVPHSSIAGLYELRIETIVPSGSSITIKVGDSWQKVFVLK